MYHLRHEKHNHPNCIYIFRFYEFQIVLPLACLDNSRYMTDDLLDEIMASLGFKKVKGHDSRKLSFKMYQKEEAKGKQDFKKRKVREGVRCNNFCITMERRGRWPSGCNQPGLVYANISFTRKSKANIVLKAQPFGPVVCLQKSSIKIEVLKCFERNLCNLLWIVGMLTCQEFFVILLTIVGEKGHFPLVWNKLHTGMI